MTKNLFVVLGCFIISTTSIFAQSYTNSSSCLDGSGDWATGGAYSNISAAGQSGGIQMSRNGDLVNYAGFLGTFSLKPGLDTDGNGVPNELDPDNDGDNLADTDEVSGDTFIPITPTDVNDPDSDGDGSSDYNESIAGTDPTDANVELKILSITETNEEQTVSWMARNGKTYKLMATDSSFEQPSQAIYTNVASGGSGLWLVTTNIVTDTSNSTNARFYAVEVLQ